MFEQMSKPCFSGFYFVSRSCQNQGIVGENVLELGGFDDNDIQLVLKGFLRYRVGKELRETPRSVWSGSELGAGVPFSWLRKDTPGGL